MAKAVKKAKTAVAKRAAKPASATKRRGVPSFTAKTAKEITATFNDSIGLTAKVAAAVAAAKVNILAATGQSASGTRRNATFTLIVDDFAKAEKALDKIGAEDIHESSIVMVETPNKVGALERVARLIGTPASTSIISTPRPAPARPRPRCSRLPTTRRRSRY